MCAATSRIASLALLLSLASAAVSADEAPPPTPTETAPVVVAAPPAAIVQPAPLPPPRRGKVLQLIGGALTAYGGATLLINLVTTLIFSYTPAGSAFPTTCTDGRNPCPPAIIYATINVLGYVFLGVAIAAISVGIPLIGVGTARENAFKKSRPRLTLSPTVGGASAGLALDF